MRISGRSASRRRAWAGVAAWVAFLFLFLPVGLTVSQYLRRRGFLAVTLVGVPLILSLALLRRAGRLEGGYPRTRLRVAAWLALIYLGMFPIVETLEEWIHFPEYLVLGVLLHTALRHDFRKPALAAVALVGGLDELIQSTLPQRFFAWWDVLLNLGGGAPPPRPPRLFGRGRRRGAGATAGRGRRMSRVMVLLFGAALLLSAAAPARAWEAAGHRAAARVAEAHLTPAARRAVRKLLRPGETLPAVSSWADAYRARPEGAHTNVWHIAFFPAGAAAFIEARDCPRRGCAVRAIREQRAALADPRQSREERRRALMLLVHLVADIHQPLHAGRREDGGGGRISVRFFTKPLNLHQVWDSALIGRAGLSEAALAERALRAAPAPLPPGGPAAWAGESNRLALSHAYTVKQGEDAGEAYMRRNFPVILRRLGAAGLRLARMLNEVLRSGR